jgi:hypothetical protein
MTKMGVQIAIKCLIDPCQDISLQNYEGAIL